VSTYALALGGIGLVLVAAVVVAWLKGNLSVVADVGRQARHQAGEPWTLGMLIEPVLSVPAVFVVAAVGLARPDSRWAGWFYGEHRLALARRRFDDEA